MLVDRPVIHLQRRIPAIPGETDNVVLPIIHWGTALRHTDIHRADVERDANFPLLLQ